jgi:intergrase/recombinase
LSGLRKQEAIQSFNLIIKLYDKGEISNYYNAKLKALEPWKYKALFLRRTKNAFITFIPESLVMQIANSKPIAYTTIRKRILSHSMHTRLNELRDYFGTYMLKHGLIEHETNILQGRIPPDSILTKHYFSPSFTELRDRTLEVITELEQALSQD